MPNSECSMIRLLFFPSFQTLTRIPFDNSFAPKFIILDGRKTGYSSDGSGGQQFEEVSLSIFKPDYSGKLVLE